MNEELQMVVKKHSSLIQTKANGLTIIQRKAINFFIFVIQESEKINKTKKGIEKLYPGSLEAIISGGCQNKLFYSGLGLKTSQYVSSLLGDKTISVMSETNNPDAMITTKSYSNTNRRLMTHDEIRRIGKEEAIFVSGNHDPMFCQVVPAYKNKNIQKLLKKYEGQVAEITQENVLNTSFIPSIMPKVDSAVSANKEKT